MATFKEYIKKVRASGKSYFTITQAVSDLMISKKALYDRIHRAKKNGDLISPAKGLYIIIPPEFQRFGSLPAEEITPILMKYWNLDYYACLLTAALYHGSSHQKPQVFQIMTYKQIKPLFLGQLKIEFIYKKSLELLPTESITVKTGYLKVASPELTVMDLLLYPNHSGGLNHIATVLSELVDVVDSIKLILLIENNKEKIWVQRLGYLLEHIDPINRDNCDLIITRLIGYLKNKQLDYVNLAPGLPKKNALYNKKWMIIENTIIESDE